MRPTLATRPLKCGAWATLVVHWLLSLVRVNELPGVIVDTAPITCTGYTNTAPDL